MGDSFTIQISSNLVNNLIHAEDKVKKKPKKSKPKAPKELPQSESKVKPVPSTQQKSTSSGGWPLQPPVFLPVPPPPPPPVEIQEVEAIRSVLRDSEKVLEKLDKQESDMHEELTHRAEELHDKEFKPPYQKPMPCVSEREACRECYKENAKQPLNCAEMVKKFADCAIRARKQVSHE